MRVLQLWTVTFLFAVTSGFAADQRDREECEEIKEEIRKIQSKMRRGYTAEQGVRLNEKLLELRERRSKACR